MEQTAGLAISQSGASRSAMPRPRINQSRNEVPPGKHAKNGPRLIGYGILGIAIVLIIVGSMWA